ncbi:MULTISPECIES: Repetin [unclassified Streptomyces]|uniref:Repetin n=1 Tax=unclassified Streptomyces TaxID=2593676 RepID=UPI00117E8943|nr:MULTISPECIES: Repetin [unclassified Streptomyces]TRO65849.1 Repetin [Streptomyces sp. IB201691-2A2]
MNRRTKTAVLGAALLVTAGATGAAASASASNTSSTAAAGETSTPSTASPASAHSVASAAGERRREAAALTGRAKLYRSAGDDITFSFDAHLAAKDTDDPLKATGTFEWSHYAGGDGAWAKAEVDCLLTGGKVAVVSGVVTDSDLPGAKGKRVGITVHDTGRQDRLGYSWASTGNPVETKDLPKCVGSAPFEKVKKGTGDFTVVPWNPRF